MGFLLADYIKLCPINVCDNFTDFVKMHAALGTIAG